MTDQDSVIRPPMVVSRRRAMWLIAGGAIASGGAAYGVGRLTRSPSQVLADTAPPAPTLLTAPVERRVLRDVVVVRGRVTARTTVRTTPKPKDVERAVLTAVLVKPGEQFQPGAVLVEVSGRPLIALPGEFPAFRDLKPGMVGRDVTQLQNALARLGHSVKTNGEFDVATKTALLNLYRRIGYAAHEAGDRHAVQAAETAVRRAEGAVVLAETELDELLSKQAEPTSSSQTIDAARRRLSAAKSDLAEARRQHDELKKASGPMLPLSEVLFVPVFPARVQQINGAVGADVADPLIVASSGELDVRSSLSSGQRQLIGRGMPVEIVSELHGKTIDGIVDDIGELVSDETGKRSHPMVVKSATQPIPIELSTTDVRLTVELAKTDGEMLVVPAAAIFAGPDSRPSVMIADVDHQYRVNVHLVASGGGFVAIAATEAQLKEGDRVVVGQTEASVR